MSVFLDYLAGILGGLALGCMAYGVTGFIVQKIRDKKAGIINVKETK